MNSRSEIDNMTTYWIRAGAAVSAVLTGIASLAVTFQNNPMGAGLVLALASIIAIVICVARIRGASERSVGSGKEVQKKRTVARAKKTRH